MRNPEDIEIRKVALEMAVRATPPAHPLLQGPDPALRRAAAFEAFLKTGNVTRIPATGPLVGERS